MFYCIGRHYFNDYTQERFEKSFATLESLFQWLRQISDSFNGNYSNYFPIVRRTESGCEVGRISVQDVTRRGWQYWIDEIRTENGTVFSNGHNTGGKCFCAVGIESWLDDSQRRMNDMREHPNFVEL